jgi:hypothetical protein
MKPVDPPSTLSVWILTSLSSSGMMTTHNASVAVASGVFPGYFTNLEDAQQEQMLLALKGQKAHVFHLEFPMP